MAAGVEEGESEAEPEETAPAGLPRAPPVPTLYLEMARIIGEADAGSGAARP